MGRNNLQNDKLTLHTARGKDLWFHVQKAPGSHCVVMSRGEDIPDTTKQEAAELAVLHSSQNGGAKVQVEYTSCPPGASAAAAQSSICAPSSAHCFTSASQCCCSATGSLRNIPSPEQGASTSTRSKNSGSASAMRAGVSLSTTALETPMRSRLLFKISARAATYSLLTSTPRPCNAAASWLLLPPGAAHRSSTRIPGCTPSSGAAEEAEGSCE